MDFPMIFLWVRARPRFSTVAKECAQRGAHWRCRRNRAAMRGRQKLGRTYEICMKYHDSDHHHDNNIYINIYINNIYIYIHNTHIYIYNIYIVWINMICQYRFLNMLIRVVLKDGRFDKIFDWWWKYLGQSPTIGRPTIKLGRVTNDNKIPMCDWWQYQWYPCTVWSLSKVN